MYRHISSTNLILFTECARDKDHFDSLGVLGQIHTCRHNGNYQQYQCIGSGCFCTDSAGNMVGTQSVSIADINNLQCGKLLTHLSLCMLGNVPSGVARTLKKLRT